MDTEKLVEYILSKTSKTNTCWLWHGLLNRNGAPIFIFNGKEFSARKYAPLLVGNSLSIGRSFVMCNNLNCVNPEHIVSGDQARFWSKIQKLSEANGGCWIWLGSEDKNGYGKFTININEKQIDLRAHRYSWELYSGREVPDRLLLCHTCDNPRCVNPYHLWIGTNLDNIRDRDHKGRKNTPVGSRSSFSKLTEEKVINIRNSDKSVEELSHIYDVNKNTIYNIRSRKTWKHI